MIRALILAVAVASLGAQSVTVHQSQEVFDQVVFTWESDLTNIADPQQEPFWISISGDVTRYIKGICLERPAVTKCVDAKQLEAFLLREGKD